MISGNVLITGGTGALGKELTRQLLNNNQVNKIIIFSRDEFKQSKIIEEFNHDRKLRFFIGDVRDLERLKLAFDDVDIVFHAAAMKRIEVCEYNVFEAIKTNILGSVNVAQASLDCKVKKVLGISTDKASLPTTLYGTTKLVMEKVFTNSNLYSENTLFSCVRYGNVLSSTGSVIPIFKEQMKKGKLKVTHPEMTRFFFTLEEAAKFSISSLELAKGGEVFIPKINSMKIVDLAKAICPDCDIEYIGLRSAEKIHEILISEDESDDVIELLDRYYLKPKKYSFSKKRNYLEGTPVRKNFILNSKDNNYFTKENIKKLI